MSEEPVQKMGHIQKSWTLTKASWHALILDKEVISLPVISSILSLLILIPAGIIAYFNPGHALYSGAFSDANIEATATPLGIAAGLLITLLLAVVATCMGAGVTAMALSRFRGEDPSVKSGMQAVKRRFSSLASFSIFSATIGYVLSQIANRIPFLGAKIVLWLADAAWGVASFFAIPIIVESKEPLGPVDATKQSIGLIKKVWGESMVASASIAVVSVLSLLAYFLVVGGLFAIVAMMSLPGIAYIILGAVAVLGLVAFSLVFTVLQAYVKAALFHYAVTGESPLHFNQSLLRQSFTKKKARKVFSV